MYTFTKEQAKAALLFIDKKSYATNLKAVYFTTRIIDGDATGVMVSTDSFRLMEQLIHSNEQEYDAGILVPIDVIESVISGMKKGEIASIPSPVDDRYYINYGTSTVEFKPLIDGKIPQAAITCDTTFHKATPTDTVLFNPRFVESAMKAVTTLNKDEHIVTMTFDDTRKMKITAPGITMLLMPVRG